METSASFEARYAPLSYPTARGDQRWSSLPQQLASGNQIREDAYGIRRLIWSAATYIRDKLNTFSR